MKKVKRILAMVLTVAALLTLAACGEKKDPNTDNKDGDKSKFKCAFLIPGPITDMSWCYNEFRGYEKVVEAGYEATYQENVSADMLVESVRTYGILSPLLARPKGEGYELVSGHRRRLAAQKLGLPTVPVLVREMTDDEAVILMVDSNLQRENLLPSEKAFAYKMKLEAMKHQGKSTSVQLAPKLTTEQIGYEAGISKDVVKRYIRLTNLVPPLLQMVDDGRIAFSPAVELSYLTRDEQAELWDLIGREDATASLSQALRIKQLSRAAKLTPEVLYAILTEEKPNQKEQIRIKTESLRKYFPRNYSAQQMEREIIKLLEARYRAKDRGER